MTNQEFAERYKGRRVRINNSWREGPITRSTELVGATAIVVNVGYSSRNSGSWVEVELEVSQCKDRRKDTRWFQYIELDLIAKPEPLPLPG